MVKELSKQLWEAKHLNPVWPSDLLENAKDPDYTKVVFNTNESGLEATLEFVDEGETVKAIYQFNKEEYLQHAYMLEPNGKSIIYDRELEVEKILTKISLNSTPLKKKASA